MMKKLPTILKSLLKSIMIMMIMAINRMIMILLVQEPVYGKQRSADKEGGKDSENTPPEPPPIETIPSRKHRSSPMDLTPPMTPPYSPPWVSPVHGPLATLPTSPLTNTTLERARSADQKIYEKASESKKRQRPKTADLGKTAKEDKAASKGSTPPARYVKASHRQSSGKHKFFKSRSGKEKEPPPPMGSSVQTKSASQPSFFNIRYKSLTNLTQQVRH